MNIPTTKASPAYEDFLNDYTEIDPNSRITRTTTRSSYAGLKRNEEAYVYDDKGLNFFDGDFHHLLDVYLDSAEAGSEVNFWALTQVIDDEYGIHLATGREINVFFYGGSPNRIYMREYIGGVSQQDSYAISLDTMYYLNITRDESVGAFGTLYCYIYSDSPRTTLLDTLSLTLIEKTDFQYIFATQTYNDGSNKAQTAYCENLDLQIPIIDYVTFYYNEGGILRVDNVTVTNGTQTAYFNETVIELASLPQNSSYVFSYFEWDSTNATTNPYDLTIPSNLTIWLYFSVAEGDYGGFVFFFFGLVVGVLVGALIGFGSKK